MELRYILEILWTRRWLAIILFSSVFFTIVVGSIIITPWYDSTARVMLRRSYASSTVFSSIGLSAPPSLTSSIGDTDRANYLALASVRPVVERVVSDLQVKRLRTRARIMKAVPFLIPVLKAVGVDVNATEEIMKAEDLVDFSVLSLIFPRPYVEIEQEEDTDILNVKAISPDPEQAMMIANAMANAFIEEERRRIGEDYRLAKEFVNLNISRAQDDYLRAATAVKEFKEKEKFVNLDSEVSDITQKIADYKKALEDNKMSISKTESYIKNIEEQLKSIPKFQKTSEQIRYNEAISNLKTSLRDQYLSLADTKTKYTKDHPSVKDIENKVALIKEMMQAELEKIFGEETLSLNSSYQGLVERMYSNYVELAGFESQNKAYGIIIKKYETEMLKLPKKVYDFAYLQITATATQDVYNSLLKNQYQLGLAESTALTNVYVVESAITPEIDDSKHKNPNLLINTIIAMLLGLPFGIGMALLVEYLDDTVKSKQDIAKTGNLYFLGSVKRLSKEGVRLISEADPSSVFCEDIRMVRNGIKYATIDKTPKCLMVAGPGRSEGRSFIAANLAIAAAREGKKTILIDGDLRNPGIQGYFTTKTKSGLTSLIVGDVKQNEVINGSGIDGLSILFGGPAPSDPARLVESGSMRQLLESMKEVYDLVILDSPPMLSVGDAAVMGQYADGIVVVVESGKTKIKDLEEISDLASKAKLHIIGAVINKAM